MFNRGGWSGLAGIAELTGNARGTQANVQMSLERGNTESFWFFFLCSSSVIGQLGLTGKMKYYFSFFHVVWGGVCGGRNNLEAVSCICGSSNPSSETLL